VAFNIVDMLRGDIVQRQQPQQNSSSGLGEMLSYLMQGTNQPVAKVPEQAQYWNPPSLSEIAQVSANRRQEKQQEDSFAKLQELIGAKGTPGNNIPTPFRGAVLPTKGTGLRGGGSLEDFAIGLAGVPDKVLATQGFDMITNLAKPPPKPSLGSMGVPNKPGWKVNFYLDANNQPVPVGEPYKADGGININTGASGAMGNILTPEENKSIGLTEKDVAQRNPQTGAISIVKSAPTLTDAQRKIGSNLMQEKALESQIKDLTNKYDPTEITLDNTALAKLSEMQGTAGSMIGAYAKKNMSPESQDYLRLMNTWIENFGRDKSGGAIVDEEYPTWRRQYFAQPGDNIDQIAKKEASRKKYMQGLKMQYGLDAPSSTGGSLKSAEQYLMENQ
jgi:hypothetical protein